MFLFNLITFYLKYGTLGNVTDLFHFDNNACTNLYDYPIKFLSKNCYENLNGVLLAHQIICQNGYQLKTYTVTTLDGYILTMFRIPPRENDNRKNKQPVYIQHGIAADSATWVATGNRSLAFNLADEGYDVWLGNQRGTRYSRKHATLKDSDFEYWNYNLDDQALNDIRTSLHEVARITRKRGSIIYIGHSKGTTLSFMFASQYPEEAQTLLRGVIALSPIAYLDVADYLKFPVMVAHRAIPILKKRFGISAMFYHTEFITKLLQHFCTYFPYICMLTLTTKFGKTSQFLADDLLVIYSHFPSTVSLTDLQHYAQMYTSKKFQKFDFGPEKNLEVYGQRTPPRYHLDNIKLPVFLFYGKDDPWVRESGVQKLFEELGSEEKNVTVVPIGNADYNYQFNHGSFTWSKNLEEFLYKHMFNLLTDKLSSNRSVEFENNTRYYFM